MTQSELKSILTYNPETGLFTWNKWRGGKATAGSVAGHVDSRGHVQICIKDKWYAAHRLAFLYMTGEFPASLTDHANCDKTDNRWCNLRLADHAQNSQNASKRKDNTSGFKGVSFHKSNNRWAANVRHNGVKIHCGYFDSASDALAAVSNKRQELHREYARHY